jgi:hypothetical protein
MLVARVDPAVLIALSITTPIVAGMHHVLAWLHYRKINRDAPLTPYQRRLTKYLDSFVLGIGYLLVVSLGFGWPKSVWVLLSVAWGFVLWAIRRRSREREKQPAANSPLG